MSFKMNKKRNVGLVYEFLARELGARLIDRDRDGANAVVSLAERHFGSGPLAEELELFRTVRDTRGLVEPVARRILERVAARAAAMDPGVVSEAKTRLIHEANRVFGMGFFDRHRISEYRLLGAIQIFIDGSRNGRLTENVRAIQIEEGLVRWMTTVPPRPVAPVRIDSLVCTFASRRFKEKYGSSLSDKQRSLLESYVHALAADDLRPLAKRLASDRREIMATMKSHQKDAVLREDKVMWGRFVDSFKRLGEMDVSSPTDEKVEEILLFHRLAEELISNE